MAGVAEQASETEVEAGGVEDAPQECHSLMLIESRQIGERIWVVGKGVERQIVEAGKLLLRRMRVAPRERGGRGHERSSHAQASASPTSGGERAERRPSCWLCTQVHVNRSSP
eukprot:3394131-Prymnesium_polylepis.1